MGTTSVATEVVPISIAVTPPSMVAVQVVSETIPLKVMVLSACATVDSALQAEKIRAHGYGNKYEDE